MAFIFSGSVRGQANPEVAFGGSGHCLGLMAIARMGSLLIYHKNAAGGYLFSGQRAPLG